MGGLPRGPFEARLAATLFLLLLGLADVFGALQVRQFAAFTPDGVAEAVGASSHQHGGERPVTLEALNSTSHHIDRELLVQDSHVHIPAYAMTAALLSLIVLGLRLRSATRTVLVGAAFAAPAVDFAGLWGAQLSSSGGRLWAAAALAGGFGMALVYVVVLGITIRQCWFGRKGRFHV
jgi:hypothetical protein